MSAQCQVTERKPGFGKSVSHSHARTSRRWDPNIQRKTYYAPSRDSWSAEIRPVLQRLPHARSPVRLRNRDAADGRPRGDLRKCGLSRIDMCEIAHRGELLGVHKSSW